MVVARLVWAVVIAVVITVGCAVVEGVSLTEGGADVTAVLLWQAVNMMGTSKSKKRKMSFFMSVFLSRNIT